MIMPGSDSMARWLEDVWLGRYLDRELTDDEAAWFEAYMLDKPRILEQVDVDTRMREGLRREISGLKSNDSRALSPTTPGALSQRSGKSSWFGLVASLAMGVFVGLVLPRSGYQDQEVIAAPKRVVFDSFRGEGAQTIMEAGAVDSPLLIVEMALPPMAGVRVARATVDGEHIELPIPQISAEGFVTFLVPSRWQSRTTIELTVQDGEKSSILTFQL